MKPEDRDLRLQEAWGLDPLFGAEDRVGGAELLVMLMKNPAGANELLRTLGRDPRPALVC